MVNFPSSIPVDIAEVRAYIRWWLGNIPPATTISDSDMDIIIAMNIGKYGDNNCKVTYYSTVDVLRWLIRKDAAGSAGSVGSGAVKERTEKEGDITVTEKYDVGVTSGESAGWDRVLEDLLASPSTIGCNPIDSTTASSTGAIIIGGGDISGVEAVYDIRMRRDAAAYKYRTPSNFPWRPNRY